jgi:N-acetylmuramoyl-L-alanine amidase
MAKSVELAKLVQKEVCAKASRPNKGVHQAGFLVLRATSMPSCLIELGFITTPDEERLLNSESGIDNHARGIYNAFLKYRKKYDSGAKGSLAETDPVKAVIKTEEQSPKVVVTETPVQESDAPKNENTTESQSLNPPVFKVQILASDVTLNPNSRQFKGEKNVECFSEGAMKKYTVGASENYNEIYRLRKSLLNKFPQAFIIAFRDNERMDVRQAILEYKERKK